MQWSMASLMVLVTLTAVMDGSGMQAAGVPPDHMFPVAQFGAAGNGTTLDTGAVQRAVDACHAAGGGTVYFAPGVYLSGTVFLKDNVRLLLEAGAVLRGSPRAEDYARIPRKNVRGQPAFPGGFLIYADGVRNVAVEGRGTIDGQGPAFWFPELVNHFVRKPMPTRPRALVCIVKSADLRFRDVTLLNSPCYTLWLIGCENVTIDAITIRNPHDGPNTDGIDVDCCRGVRIANCHIDGGDDAIALKSDSGTLGEDKPCEDVVVTNCVLCSVPACGVRIGYEGDSIIRNCTFSNLAIFDTDIGIDIISILPDRPDCAVLKGTRCENLAFSGITMRNVNRALFFWMGNETRAPAQIHMKNIQVANVIAESRIGSFIGGCSQKSIENVSLANVHLAIAADMPAGATVSGSQIWGGSWNPYGLYCHWVDGLSVESVRLDLRQAKGHWRYGLFCEQVRGAEIAGFRTQGFAALPGQASIGLKSASATVRSCAAEAGVAAFVAALEGSDGVLTGCNLAPAKKAFVTDKGATVTCSGNLAR